MAAQPLVWMAPGRFPGCLAGSGSEIRIIDLLDETRELLTQMYNAQLTSNGIRQRARLPDRS